MHYFTNRTTGMNHVAIFYTHNAIDARVLGLSLRHFQNMVGMYGLPLKTHGVVVSCEPVNEFLTSMEHMSVTNLVAPVEIRNLGHLRIVEKITLAMEVFPSDFVSLHEHDVLYPEDYLLVCQELLQDYANLFDYVAYDRIMGV